MPGRAPVVERPRADRPLVSVVIPTRDRPALLADAVRSVAEQTYQPIELVVVDDGSSVDPDDGLRDVEHVARTDEGSSLTDVHLVRHGENRGANAARNTGVEHARGDYVAFLDDDDYWRPAKVERQVAALERTSGEVAVAFVGREDVDDAGDVVRIERPTPGGDFAKQLAVGAHFGTFSTVMVEAAAFERTGPLDVQMPCWQDREWYFRLAAHYDYVAIRELLTVRRIGDLPQLSDDYEAQREVAYPRLLEKHAPTVATLGPEYERRFRAELSRGVGSAALSDGRYVEAIRFLLRSLRHDPLRAKTLGYLLVALGGPWTHRAAREGRRRIHE